VRKIWAALPREEPKVTTGAAVVPTIDRGDCIAVVEVTKDQHGPAVLASG
jgi:hypothetical protein